MWVGDPEFSVHIFCPSTSCTTHLEIGCWVQELGLERSFPPGSQRGLQHLQKYHLRSESPLDTKEITPIEAEGWPVQGERIRGVTNRMKRLCPDLGQWGGNGSQVVSPENLSRNKGRAQSSTCSHVLPHLDILLSAEPHNICVLSHMHTEVKCPHTQMRRSHSLT